MRGERKELLHNGSSGEQVCCSPFQLPRRRSCQSESAIAFLFHQKMHFVEQFRNALHLVDNDPSGVRLRLDLLPEKRRITLITDRRLREKKIHRERGRKLLPQPRALSGTARAEQEERRFGNR